MSKEQQDANWFSAPSALRVYGEKILWIIQRCENSRNIKTTGIPVCLFGLCIPLNHVGDNSNNKTTVYALTLFDIFMMIWKLKIWSFLELEDCKYLQYCKTTVSYIINNMLQYSLVINTILQDYYTKVQKMLQKIVFVNFVGQYLSLDTDHNGMLSKEELAR